MQISLLETATTDGRTDQINVPFEMDAIAHGGNTYPVLGQPMLKVRLENVGKKVIDIYADTEVKVSIPCDRCLTPTQVIIPVHAFQRLDTRQDAAERIADLDECAFVTGMDLDPDLFVYFELLMNWPDKILCRQDCLGLCSRCGKNLNEGSCDCADEPKDPRMAAISDIFKKYKEV